MTLRLHHVLAAAALLVWVGPIVQGALAGHPSGLLPPRLRDAYSIACLFPDRPQQVAYFVIQTRSAGDPYWRDFPEPEYFRMEVFGHRTRFDRFMLRWGGDEAATRELAVWIAGEHSRRHPDAAAIVAVRFLVGHVAIDASAPPSGAWQDPRDRIGLRTLAQHVVP